MTSLLISEGSDSAAAMGAGEGIASPWLCATLTPRRTHGSRRRSPRTRSSPVRSIAVASEGRARSPSVSPRFCSPVRGETGRHLSRLHLESQYCVQKLDWPYGSAYYSVQPPAGPIQLVPSPLQHSRAESPLRQPDCSTPIVPPPLPFSEAKEPSIDSCSRQPKKRRLSGNNRRQLVRRLLRELVTNLPLPTTTSPCRTYRETTVSPVFLPATKVSQAVSTISASLMSTPRTTPECKHVAIQAPGQNIKSTDDIQDEDDYFIDDEHQPSNDEWVGGVRALRDSHVRLVLRQLRHIDRLNRALDRAAPTSSARPARL